MSATALDAGHNRRRHRRIALDENICSTVGFRTLNISESGLLLSTTRSYRIGAKRTLALILKDQTISVEIEILRCVASKAVFDPGYRLGVRFRDLSIQNTLRLREFIDTCER